MEDRELLETAAQLDADTLPNAQNAIEECYACLAICQRIMLDTPPDQSIAGAAECCMALERRIRTMESAAAIGAVQ